MILDKQTPQGVGSALTYAKRQILQAMFGLSAGPEEDDDAEGSTNRVDDDDDSEYEEKTPPTKTAYQLAKLEIKNIKTIEMLADWWTNLPETSRNNKQVRDLKDSRKAELNVKG